MHHAYIARVALSIMGGLLIGKMIYSSTMRMAATTGTMTNELLIYSIVEFCLWWGFFLYVTWHFFAMKSK